MAGVVMLPPTLTADAAVETHIGLARGLRTATAEQMMLELAAASPSGTAMSADVLAHGVATADTFVVSAEMMRWAADASDDLDGMPIFAHNLPSPNMLILLDESDWFYFSEMLLDTPFEQAIAESPIRALSVADVGRTYGPDATVSYQDPETGRETTGDGIAMVMWIDPLTRIGDAPTGPLFPIDTTGWAYGQSWETLSVDDTAALWEQIHRLPGKVAHHAGTMRRRILSLLLLMGEDVYTRRDRVEARPTRRRWKSSLLTPPDDYSVAVTRLRRSHRDSTGRPEGQGEAFYSHRWFVRGHWRRINRGTPRERAVWVRPHIKGPEDAPMVEKFRVTRLDR